MKRAAWTAVLIVMILPGCSDDPPPPAGLPDSDLARSEYVGAEACRTCHQDAWTAWRGSHHDLALQQPDESTVLADFETTQGEVGFESTEGRYRIRPDESSPALDVRYVFGVSPLQQYVVQAESGRLQTFPVPWDTRSADEGGQRWYELYPGDWPQDDPTHWKGRANNWNAMCADCHSTGVEKRYDPATRSYDTRFAEEDVACEACHGPGSQHQSDPAAYPLASLSAQQDQLNACAPCHSRRSQLAEGFTPGDAYLDFYAPALLRPGLYHTDGQIQDEVYVYGSFLQTRMHRRGVQCSHCHDAHTAELKLAGNETCTQCHQPSARTDFPTLKAADYDTPDHHFHPSDTEAARCVSCHMASATYMGVDDRRDHSFRIPRPDLTASIGVPNACNGCHTDQSSQWAADSINEHFPDSPRPHFASVFSNALNGSLKAESGLAGLVGDEGQPIMVRATALAMLGGYSRGYTLDAVRLGRSGPPLLRMAAPLGAAGLSPQAQWRLISGLLDDELLSVRDQAFVALLPLADSDPQYQTRLQAYLPAYLEDHALNADFPETLTNVAAAHLSLGDLPAAEAALVEALAIQPSWVPALLNLADLYRSTARDSEAGDLIVKAIQTAPNSPNPSFSYGLWLTRQAKIDEALGYFMKAYALAPDQVQYGYALALAMNDAGDAAGAVAQLETMLARWPTAPDLLIAVVTMLRDQQRFSEALVYLDRLIELRPGDEGLIEFRSALLAAAGVG